MLITTARVWPMRLCLALALVACLGGLAFRRSGVEASYSPALASPDTSWQQQYQLRSTNAAAQSFFGNDVAISGNTAIVGAFREGGNFAGAAYIFVRNGAKWS